MNIEKREQVFVSSTFKDLEEERRAVIQTLLEADCIPAGMEMFPASNSQKFDLIKSVIDLCDYYVVIIGGRYGSVDAEAELSYTEMEYDYAVSKSIPVMGFLHGDAGNIPANKIELDPEMRNRLDSFRQKVEQRMVKYWKSPDDLGGQVARALIQIRKSEPAVGWIRADQAMTPEVRAELAELRAKVRELTSELGEEKRQQIDGLDVSELAQGEEEASLSARIEYFMQSQIDADTDYPRNRYAAYWTVTPTWNQIFKHLAPELMDEATEHLMKNSLSTLCLVMSRTDLIGNNDDGDDEATGDATGDEEDESNEEEDDTVGRIEEAHITDESFNDVKVQLVALGLIEQGVKRRNPSNTQNYWRLTDRGHQLILRLRTTRRKLVKIGSSDTPTDNT